MIKEQYNSIASNRDAESRVHSEVISSLDSTMAKLKQDLSDERSERVILDEKLGCKTQELRETQKSLAQAQHEKSLLKEAVSQAEVATSNLEEQCRTSAAALDALRAEKQEMVKTDLRKQALLENGTETQAHQAEQIQSLQARLDQSMQECREVVDREATLKLEIQRKDREAEQLRTGFDEAVQRQQQSDKARLNSERNLEATMKQLSEATVSAAAVYDKSRAEFTETTSRYEDELAAHKTARESLESSLAAGEKSVAQLKARLAETEAVHSAAAASNQDLHRQLQSDEKARKDTEKQLLNARQDIGRLEGEKSVLSAEPPNTKMEVPRKVVL